MFGSRCQKTATPTKPLSALTRRIIYAMLNAAVVLRRRQAATTLYRVHVVETPCTTRGTRPPLHQVPPPRVATSVTCSKLHAPSAATKNNVNKKSLVCSLMARLGEGLHLVSLQNGARHSTRYTHEKMATTVIAYAAHPVTHR